ncbi:MAG: tyrosinase family protein [Ramlibacter sp.]
MTQNPRDAFSPSRRTILKTAGLGVGAGMLPFGASFAQALAKPARHRRYNASSKMGAHMLKSYAKAIRAMLALPPEDPRNWYRHAMVHTLDCPHGNWWLLPWHRGYLGWFEQICRELSGDPHFALPYWDWTAEQKVPSGMFDDVLDPNHPAYIPNARDFEHRLKTALVNSDYWTLPDGVFNRNTRYGQLLIRKFRFADDIMFDIVGDPSGPLFYEQSHARGIRREQPALSAATIDAVSTSTILAALAAPDFQTFGSLKSANHHTMAGFSIIEGRPHNSIHRCVGSHDCNFMDAEGFMTNFLSPVDPIFFLHHANLDRLWDVWTRKQQLLGLPVVPSGVELRTDLPDEQKSAEEKNTDYYRWAREPMLFFVDSEGRQVTKTRAEDYLWTSAFSYDYEPGSGEEVVRQAGGQPRPRAAARRVYAGKVQNRQVRGPQPASATVQLPASVAGQAGTAGATLVANVTLNFSEMTHDAFVVILNGPDDPSHVEPGSPFYLATISMIGGHGTCGALSYALPLGEKLSQAGMAQAMTADGSLRLRVLPLHAMMGHPGMGSDNPVELLAVNVETY